MFLYITQLPQTVVKVSYFLISLYEEPMLYWVVKIEKPLPSIQLEGFREHIWPTSSQRNEILFWDCYVVELNMYLLTSVEFSRSSFVISSQELYKWSLRFSARSLQRPSINNESYASMFPAKCTLSFYLRACSRC